MKKLTMSNLIEEVNTNLKQAIPESHLNTDLEESMMYSLQAGGKNSTCIIITYIKYAK